MSILLCGFGLGGGMMERLTRCVGCQNGNPIYKTNIDMRCIGAVDKLKNALGKYEDLDEQGLLLRLPCKVGDTVYKPNPITLSEIVEIKIESIFITETKINISGRTTKMKYSFCCSPSDFGKTIFLTQAGAEQKLKEMESD